MPAPMEGPFAAKLRAAAAGPEFPKVASDASAMAESLDLSGGGKSRRERRKGKHEQYEREQRKREDGEGVSGHAVHTRGRFVETEPVAEVVESPEQQAAKRLFDEISVQCEALNQLNAFMEAKGYKDSEGTLSETVAARLERANQTMLPLKERGSITATEVGSLAELLKESNQDIAELKEALEGLESAGEIVLPPEIKSLLEAKPEPSPREIVSQDEPINAEQPLVEKRSYASFNADELRALWRKQGALDCINMVTDQLKEWQAFDQKIREYKDEGRFKDDLKERGLGEKYDQVLRLTGRGENIATRLEEIRRAFEERGELDQKEAAFLTAIFFDYHELLAVAEGIVADRGRETPIVEAEKDARIKKQGEKKAGKRLDSLPPFDVEDKQVTGDLSIEESTEQIALLKNKIKEWRNIYEELSELFGEKQLRKLIIENSRMGTLSRALISGNNLEQANERIAYWDDVLAKNGSLDRRGRAWLQRNISALQQILDVSIEVRNHPHLDDGQYKERLSFEDKVVRLKELLDQWEVLEREFGAEPLRQAVRSLRRLEKRGSVPPTGKIAEWFAGHDGPKAWQGKAAAADRALLTDDALPGMESMVQDGRLVAEKLRKERSEREAATPLAPATAERKDNEPIARGDIWEAPPKDSTHAGRRIVVSGITPEGKIEYRFFNFDEIGNAQNMGFGMHDSERTLREWLAAEGYAYKERREEELDPPAASVLTLDRRPVIDGELTEWERMNPVEQNRLRRDLFSRKDRFVSGLNDRLKRAGVTDADRRNTIAKYLDEYLPRAIELVVTVPLQDTDRESLLRDLKKEIAIT